MSRECGKFEPLLTQLCLGELEPEAEAAVREHLVGCERCRTLAADIESAVVALRSAFASGAAAPRPMLDAARRAAIQRAAVAPPAGPALPFRLLPAFAAAAAVIVAVSGAAFLIGKAGRGREEKTQRLAAKTAAPAERIPALPAVRLPELPAPLAPPESPPLLSETRALAPVPEPIAPAVAPPVKLPPAVLPESVAPAPEAAPLLSSASVKVRPELKPAGPVAESEAPGAGLPFDVEAAAASAAGKEPRARVELAQPSQASAASTAAAAPPAPRPPSPPPAPPKPPLRPAWPARPAAAGPGMFAEAESAPVSLVPATAADAGYRIVRKRLSAGLAPAPESVRMEEIINYFSYEPKNMSGKALALSAIVAPSPFKDGVHLLRVGIKARDPDHASRPAAVLTAVVDTSPSMNAPEKIGLVRKSLLALLNRLKPEDKLAVLAADRMLPDAAPVEYMPAAKKTQLLSAIAGLRPAAVPCDIAAIMKASVSAALRAAAPSAANRILLFSDGAAAPAGLHTNAAAAAEVAAARRRGLDWTICVMNPDAYAETPPFLDFADAFDCDYRVLDAEDEALAVFDAPAWLDAAAIDVEVRVEFNSASVKRYRLLGYEPRPAACGGTDDARGGTRLAAGRHAVAVYELELAAGPREDLGMVRLSFVDAETGRREQIRLALKPGMVLPRYELVDKRFMFTAVAARWAELLRSPQAPRRAAGEYEKITALLLPLASEPGREGAVKDLLAMVRRSAELARSGVGAGY